VNADIDNAYTIGTWAQNDGGTEWFVTRNKTKRPESTFWITDVSSNETSCTFRLHFGTKKYEITAPIRGEHFVINVSLAIAAAVASGMDFADACTYAKQIRSFHQVMEPSVGTKGEILINDTFNNNPEAAIAALQYLEKFPKRKLLVFQPMIELGAFTDVSHERVGQKAGEVCDDIILTNSNFSGGFIRGVENAYKKRSVHIFTTAQAVQYIRKHVAKGDAILFKGKEAGFVWKELTKRS